MLLFQSIGQQLVRVVDDVDFSAFSRVTYLYIFTGKLFIQLTFSRNSELEFDCQFDEIAGKSPLHGLQ